MGVRLKPIDQQTLVITGASSGIGLTTARMAARRGAGVVLAARSEGTLREIVDGLRAEGCEASYCAVDVSREEDVQRLADHAVRTFGGFDTWINCAAISIYGRIIDIAIEDHRRIFEVNYWGYVYGARAAAAHFRHRFGDDGNSMVSSAPGGAIINIGSVLSDRSIPMQGPYCATKGAVKNFTDSLRMELEEIHVPVSVTLIKPSAIDTPYKDHAKNLLPHAPQNPPPVYAPETVARAVLHAAQHPVRDLTIGAGGWMVSLFSSLFPRLSDIGMEHVMSYFQQTDRPAGPRQRHALYEPMAEGEERGGYPHHVLETSAYTQARMHPLLTAALLGAAGLAIGVALSTPRTASAPDRRSERVTVS